jgi:hypothetical protein
VEACRASAQAQAKALSAWSGEARDRDALLSRELARLGDRLHEAADEAGRARGFADDFASSESFDSLLQALTT